MTANMGTANASKTDPEYDLLPEDSSIAEEGSATNHSLKTVPAFNGEALDILGPTVLPQRALYGRLISQHASDLPSAVQIPKIYINSNTPFSAVVCGVQGSGKSHSTAVLLESCLMTDPRIGTLPEPLSALVFHFDTAAGGGLVQPSEAAYLSALNPKLASEGVSAPNVTVLVVPTYLKAMRKVYAGLPAVKVEPLLLAPGDISGERLLAMMKVDESKEMPLYMESIMMILRSMQDDFEYSAFRAALDKQKFNKSQVAMLRLRLALLDSCLQGGNETNSVTTYFRKGHLTIIDLSSPFMDGSSACGFFDMILGLFVEAEVGASGKIVVLDEAHKYLSECQVGSSGRLTDSLLTVVRQQRHLSTRVVISTQEPSVVPSKFLALCSIIIAHRFSSPTWLQELGRHVSAAQSSTEELFSKIIRLPTGQAIMFSPSALSVQRQHSEREDAGDDTTSCSVTSLGQGYFLVHSRLRITRDGGHSLLAVADPNNTTRLQRVSGRSVPVHDAGAANNLGTQYASRNPIASPVPVRKTAALPSSASRLMNFSSSQPDVAKATSSRIDTLISPNPCIPTDSRASIVSPETEISQPSEPAKATASSYNVPSEVALRDKYGRFASLAHFLLSQRACGASPVTIDAAQRHFSLLDPAAFDSSGAAFQCLLFEALQKGIVKSTIKNNCMMLEASKGLLKTRSALQTPAQSSQAPSNDTPTPSANVTTTAIDVGDKPGIKTLVNIFGQRFAYLAEFMLRKRKAGFSVVEHQALCDGLLKEYSNIYGASSSAAAMVVSDAVVHNILKLENGACNLMLNDEHLRAIQNGGLSLSTGFVVGNTQHVSIAGSPDASALTEPQNSLSPSSSSRAVTTAPSDEVDSESSARIQPCQPTAAVTSRSTPSQSVRVKDPHLEVLVSQYGRFACLVDFMLCECAMCGTEWEPRHLLRQKLAEKYPAAYGTSLGAVDEVIAAAINLKFLEQKVMRGVRTVALAQSGRKFTRKNLFQLDSEDNDDKLRTVIYMQGYRSMYAPVIRFLQDRIQHGQTSLKDDYLPQGDLPAWSPCIP